MESSRPFTIEIVDHTIKMNLLFLRANDNCMGWKASMILVEDKANSLQDDAILNALGVIEYKRDGEWSLEKCIYPRDRSISIGRIGQAVVICEDLQLVDSSMTIEPAKYESELSKINPNGEILSVACLSSVNYHGYSLMKSGAKIRFKQVGSDSTLKEGGDLLAEEIAIYDQSVEKDGKTVWPSSLKANADVFEEDQLLEEFTFELAKRIVKVRIDEEEGEELFFNVPFTRYVVSQWDMPETEDYSDPKGKGKLLVMGLVVLAAAVLAYMILFK